MADATPAPSTRPRSSRNPGTRVGQLRPNRVGRHRHGIRHPVRRAGSSCDAILLPWASACSDAATARHRGSPQPSVSGGPAGRAVSARAGSRRRSARDRCQAPRAAVSTRRGNGSRLGHRYPGFVDIPMPGDPAGHRIDLGLAQAQPQALRNSVRLLRPSPARGVEAGRRRADRPGTRCAAGPRADQPRANAGYGRHRG